MIPFIKLSPAESLGAKGPAALWVYLLRGALLYLVISFLLGAGLGLFFAGCNLVLSNTHP